MGDITIGRTREQVSAICRQYGEYAKVAFAKPSEAEIVEAKGKRKDLRKEALAKLSPAERDALDISLEKDEK